MTFGRLPLRHRCVEDAASLRRGVIIPFVSQRFPRNSLYPGTHQELRSPFHSNCSSNPTHAQNIHLKIFATSTSTDNGTRIRHISIALNAANKTAITFPAAAPTPPPTPALPNEDPIVTRSRNALARHIHATQSNDNPRIKYRPDSPILPTPRPCQSTTDRHRYTHPGPPFVRNHVHSMHYRCIRSNEGCILHARFVSFDYRQRNPQVPATMGEGQLPLPFALHARNHSRTPRRPNPPISRFQQRLFDTEMLYTELGQHRARRLARSRSLGRRDKIPRNDERFGRSPAGRDRRTKANRIAVQTIRTSTQALTRCNAYYRIYPHHTYPYTRQHQDSTNRPRKFAPHLKLRAVLQARGLDNTRQPLDDRARRDHEPCRYRHSTTFGGKRQPTEGVM
ncbi:hypothetical protein B0F90DRAFT_1110260 [Multifurca ochricompacta]|uniref:Uncharacterized protein n=1 Tax=Multifurca ochricompacta TaxID=376703 RepID=A0AAD4QLB2_9AGAM|nr:hypothetical protein B0F90DRAFT_1110260 [Multifurca ochricompacta]